MEYTITDASGQYTIRTDYGLESLWLVRVEPYNIRDVVRYWNDQFTYERYALADAIMNCVILNNDHTFKLRIKDGPAFTITMRDNEADSGEVRIEGVDLCQTFYTHDMQSALEVALERVVKDR